MVLIDVNVKAVEKDNVKAVLDVDNLDFLFYFSAFDC